MAPGFNFVEVVNPARAGNALPPSSDSCSSPSGSPRAPTPLACCLPGPQSRRPGIARESSCRPVRLSHESTSSNFLSDTFSSGFFSSALHGAPPLQSGRSSSRRDLFLLLEVQLFSTLHLLHKPLAARREPLGWKFGAFPNLHPANMMKHVDIQNPAKITRNMWILNNTCQQITMINVDIEQHLPANYNDKCGY